MGTLQVNEQSLRLFLQAVNAKQIEVKGKWLVATCPLAPFLHSGGTDNSPSFGIRLGNENPFNCFVCERGSLHKLVSTLDFHLSKAPAMQVFYNLKAARDILDGAELDFVPLPDFEDTSLDQKFVPWPESVLNLFGKIEDAPQAIEYLAKRDGALNVLQSIAAELRYDHHKKMIVAPYRNAYGTLSGLRGRSIDPECPKAYRHYDYLYEGVSNAPLVWYNEPALMLDGPVVVVEGQFDCQHVRKVWPKVIANLTAKPSQAKLKKLSGCDQVIILGDNDDAGRHGTKIYQEYLLAQGVQVGVLEMPKEFHDPAQLPLDWLHKALNE